MMNEVDFNALTGRKMQLAAAELCSNIGDDHDLCRREIATDRVQSHGKVFFLFLLDHADLFQGRRI